MYLQQSYIQSQNYNTVLQITPWSHNPTVELKILQVYLKCLSMHVIIRQTCLHNITCISSMDPLTITEIQYMTPTNIRHITSADLQILQVYSDHLSMHREWYSNIIMTTNLFNEGVYNHTITYDVSNTITHGIRNIPSVELKILQVYLNPLSEATLHKHFHWRPAYLLYQNIRG